ncbi:MAG: serine--tRNA ligase [Alphaproteobacteria bacterium]|nr:serine--tRNA ligase [Alphaproteobacteria bacterium]MCL2757794.1 serine--tRNA ligase [Alphaproteobacteria bacterium]
MIDLKFIREHPDAVRHACKVKNFDDVIDKILELDVRVRALKTSTQTKTAEKNKITAAIAATDTCGRAPLVAESKKIGAEIADDEAALKTLEAELSDLLHRVPQIPSPDSPVGPDATANVVTKIVGKPAKLDFTPRAHYEIMDMNGWWMPEKIAEICGSRTYCLMGAAAELDLAIQTFVIQKMITKGFIFIQVPAIVRPQMVFDAGHFPGGDLSVMDNDVFYLNVPDKCLSGTGEIVINSLHRDETMPEDALPLKYVGWSPCFRKEAGAAGRDTRGLVRVHQFHKVEQFIFCKPEQSEEMYKLLLGLLEEILTDLELPYHVLSTSTGDMGFNKIKMDDMEAWMPSANKYVELGSCSAIGEFQSRRTNTRYRENGTNEVKFCATLNNTAMALPRTLAAVIENHQNADGSVNIPKALHPLMGGRKKIGTAK